MVEIGVRPEVDYAERAWSDLEPLRAYGDEPAAVVKRLRRMLAGVEKEDEDLLTWMRRDLQALSEDPDVLYSRVAAGGPGEAIFRHGRAALDAAGYGGLADGIHPWSANRFVGLGCPWVAGLPQPGETIVDVGCGSGVDVAIAAAAVGDEGRVVGLDIRSELLPPAEAIVTGTSFVVAPADATTLSDAFATLVVANGLPTLLSIRTACDVLRETHRVLRHGGEIRAILMVTGPDRRIDELDALTVVNAVRCGKPICSQFRSVFTAAGFADVTLTTLASPFVVSFQPGPVAAVLVQAQKP